MASYKIEIGNHPAQARHPFTGEPLVDDDGQPVPLFPNERSVKLDGRVIAYVNQDRKVLFVVPRPRLGTIADEAIELVKKELGGEGEFHSIAEPPEEIDTELDEEDK